MQSLYDTYAWFSKDIAVDFGPLGYLGLPGVILGLEYNHLFIYAIEVDVKANPAIRLPDIKTYSSKEHYDKIYDN